MTPPIDDPDEQEPKFGVDSSGCVPPMDELRQWLEGLDDEALQHVVVKGRREMFRRLRGAPHRRTPR